MNGSLLCKPQKRLLPQPRNPLEMQKLPLHSQMGLVPHGIKVPPWQRGQPKVMMLTCQTLSW